MDGCVYPYRHIAPAAEHPFHRAALGIAADAVVIGAFVSPLKLSRRCLALWRDVLERVPRAQLAFSPVNPALRATLRAACSRPAGIAPDRAALPAAGTRRRREPGALRARRLRARPDALRRRQRHARGARHGRAGGHAASASGTASARRIRSSPISASPTRSRTSGTRIRRDRRAPRDRSRRSCATCATRIRAGLAAFAADRHASRTRARSSAPISRRSRPARARGAARGRVTADG